MSMGVRGRGKQFYKWAKFEIDDTGTNKGAENKNRTAIKYQYFNMCAVFMLILIIS